jgi:hypothetical protein
MNSFTIDIKRLEDKVKRFTTSQDLKVAKPPVIIFFILLITRPNFMMKEIEVDGNLIRRVNFSVFFWSFIGFSLMIDGLIFMYLRKLRLLSR